LTALQKSGLPPSIASEIASQTNAVEATVSLQVPSGCVQTVVLQSIVALLIWEPSMVPELICGPSNVPPVNTPPETIGSNSLASFKNDGAAQLQGAHPHAAQLLIAVSPYLGADPGRTR
jgi:hypothetical protein